MKYFNTNYNILELKSVSINSRVYCTRAMKNLSRIQVTVLAPRFVPKIYSTKVSVNFLNNHNYFHVRI